MKILLLSILFILINCGGSSNSSNGGAGGARVSSGANGSSASWPSEFDSVSEYDSIIFDADYEIIGNWEKNQSVSSSITGITYGYEVYLPPEYDLEPDRSFPVLYITDAQFDVNFQANVLDNERRPVIMVAIYEGPSSRRAIDYILPGAKTYFQFFTEEFIPTIETQYRIQGDDRTFVGASAGGQASIIMLLLDTTAPVMFKRHIAFDPFITSRVMSLVDEQVSAGEKYNKALFISAAYGARGLGPSVTSFVSYLRSKEIANLVIYDRMYNVQHEDATWASLATALNLIYEQYDNL